MSETLLDKLIQAIPDALLLVRPDGRIFLANRQAEEMFGHCSGGLRDMPVEALMPKSVRSRHCEHREGFMAQPQIRAMGMAGAPLVAQRKDGGQFPVEIALSPLAGDEGDLYVASIRDISESRRARQVAVRAGYDALAAKVGQLALESTDVAPLMLDIPRLLAQALAIESVAVAFLRSGAGQDERLEIAASYGFQDSDTWLDPGQLPKVRKDGLPSHIENLALWQPQTETAAMQPEGSMVLMPLRGRAGNIGALVAIANQAYRFDHDALHLLRSMANLLAALVQRKRTEEQLAHVQRLDAIGQMTGGIAHDFNNLLTIVSGNLQLIEVRCQDDPDSTELVESALHCVQRGAALTGKMLAFSRRQRLRPRPLDAAALLQDLAVMMRGTLGDSIQLLIRAGDDLPELVADPVQLETALLNLALNARDAMPGGGRIEILARECWISPDQARPQLEAGHYLAFAVVDTGTGMDPATLSRAVEPFFTTKPSGHGTGLGLSMVYGFARQSGGHLQIDSSEGVGTRAEIFLPVTLARTAQAPRSAATAANPPHGNTETVLVVEDDPDVRRLATTLLRSLGYQVSSVAEGAQALEELRGNPAICLLFSDVLLGSGMDGRQLSRAACALRPDLQVLLVSGCDSADDEASDFELLRKPYSRESLALAVGRLLNRRNDSAS